MTPPDAPAGGCAAPPSRPSRRSHPLRRPARRAGCKSACACARSASTRSLWFRHPLRGRRLPPRHRFRSARLPWFLLRRDRPLRRLRHRGRWPVLQRQPLPTPRSCDSCADRGDRDMAARPAVPPSAPPPSAVAATTNDRSTDGTASGVQGAIAAGRASEHAGCARGIHYASGSGRPVPGQPIFQRPRPGAPGANRPPRGVRASAGQCIPRVSHPRAHARWESGRESSACGRADHPGRVAGRARRHAGQDSAMCRAV